MTCAEFRESPELVGEMRKILDHHVMKLWIETYRNDPLENPVKKVAPAGITTHGAHIMLGEQTSWNVCLDRFLLGGQAIEGSQKPLDQSYAEPPPETE